MNVNGTVSKDSRIVRLSIGRFLYIEPSQTLVSSYFHVISGLKNHCDIHDVSLHGT